MKGKKTTYRMIIGREAIILEHPDPTLRGLRGIITDETMHTIVIRSNGREKRVSKNHLIMKIRFGDKELVIHDTELLGRPDERTKKAIYTG